MVFRHSTSLQHPFWFSIKAKDSQHCRGSIHHVLIQQVPDFYVSSSEHISLGGECLVNTKGGSQCLFVSSKEVNINLILPFPSSPTDLTSHSWSSDLVVAWIKAVVRMAYVIFSLALYPLYKLKHIRLCSSSLHIMWSFKMALRQKAGIPILCLLPEKPCILLILCTQFSVLVAQHIAHRLTHSLYLHCSLGQHAVVSESIARLLLIYVLRFSSSKAVASFPFLTATPHMLFIFLLGGTLRKRNTSFGSKISFFESSSDDMTATFLFPPAVGLFSARTKNRRGELTA